jgi:hypothetical protein
MLLNRIRSPEFVALSSALALAVGGTACSGAKTPIKVETSTNPANTHVLNRDSVGVMEVFSPGGQTLYTEQDSLCDGTEWVQGEISIEKSKTGYKTDIKASADKNSAWCHDHPGQGHPDTFTYYLNGLRIDRIFRFGGLLSRVAITLCDGDTLVQATGEIDSAAGFSDKPTTIGIANSKTNALECTDNEITPEDNPVPAGTAPSNTVNT